MQCGKTQVTAPGSPLTASRIWPYKSAQRICRPYDAARGRTRTAGTEPLGDRCDRRPSPRAVGPRPPPDAGRPGAGGAGAGRHCRRGLGRPEASPARRRCSAAGRGPLGDDGPCARLRRPAHRHHHAHLRGDRPGRARRGRGRPRLSGGRRGHGPARRDARLGPLRRRMARDVHRGRPGRRRRRRSRPRSGRGGARHRDGPRRARGRWRPGGLRDAQQVAAGRLRRRRGRTGRSAGAGGGHRGSAGAGGLA